MSSPFPGMDPYLEDPAYWRDFHQRFITYWCDWLYDHLPDHYEVSIDERMSIVDESTGGSREMLPDLSISQVHPLPTGPVAEGSEQAVDVEPVSLKIQYLDEETEAFLQVKYRPDASVITTLELLSPTNKEGKGRQQYLEKRNELIRDDVHMVELDLLLGGARLPTEGKLPPGDYYAYVSRGDQRPRCDVYGWPLPHRLPRIKIPLKAPDPDVVFDLQELFAETFRRGRYLRRLPYAVAPVAPLSEANAAWVRQRLQPPA